MFLDHFHLTAHPFCERPDRDQLLRDERMGQGLARLDYLAAQGTLGLLVGTTGVGKSSLLRLWIESLSPHQYQPVYLHLTHVETSALLRLIVTALGQTPRLGKDRLFLQILDPTHRERTPVLIIDEAHLLPPDALTDLRLLVSSGLHAAPFKMVLSGQEPLREHLNRASHADLANRIAVRYHLHPFSQDQTVAYLDFRLRTAGAPDKLFVAEAKRLIHHYAGGVPRQVNNLATACLLNAASHGLAQIDEDLVNDTVRECHLT